jgi:hypothetical protein
MGRAHQFPLAPLKMKLRPRVKFGITDHTGGL